MSNYVPFLKLKSSETMALDALSSDVTTNVTPFFDLARNTKLDENGFVNYVLKRERACQKYLSKFDYFYLDNFDISSSLTVNNKNCYWHTLDAFREHSIVPVVAIDRDPDHVDSVKHFRNKYGDNFSNTVCVRFTVEDFEDFDLVENEIDNKLDGCLNLFQSVDLVFDCRLCSSLHLSKISNQIAAFYQKFQSKYSVRNSIVTGSSIPASSSELLKPNSHVIIERKELILQNILRDEYKSKIEFSIGDYATVSPEYSDVVIPPEQMQSRITPRICYSFDQNFVMYRGGAIKTHKRGRKQYNDLAETLVRNSFFRKGSSWGDNFLFEASRNGNFSVTQTTIVKPQLNAHISYMASSYA